MNRINGGSARASVMRTGAGSNNNSNALTTKVTGSSVNSRKPMHLTPKQLEERRLKDQCFWCEEKFILGHKCKNRQLYLLIVQDE